MSSFQGGHLCRENLEVKGGFEMSLYSEISMLLKMFLKMIDKLEGLQFQLSTIDEHFSNGVAMIKYNDKWRAINKNGKPIVRVKYNTRK